MDTGAGLEDTWNLILTAGGDLLTLGESRYSPGGGHPPNHDPSWNSL